jgi:hypothetical protein
MSPLLAKEIPFNCPKCRYVAMDRTSLIRHFATRHGLVEAFLKVKYSRRNSVPDPHVLGPPGSGSISQRYGSGSGSIYHQAKIVRKNLDSYCLVTSFRLFTFEK